ncbi:MAG TPA: hydrogenase maturation protease [Anaerohalosphaeraceae bacterium]|nr:hydrogenase maturation protease [Anaerohalosphaeraceae bacterium]
MPEKPVITVIGLGNELMTDDGLGVHAIRLFQQERLHDEVQAIEVGAAVIHFQDMFEQSDIIIALDAICAGGTAGQMYCLDGEDALAGGIHSLHDLGIAGVCRLIPEARRPRLIILGAEPGLIDYGTALSPALQAIIPQLVQAVKEVIQKLKNAVTRISIDDLFSVRI